MSRIKSILQALVLGVVVWGICQVIPAQAQLNVGYMNPQTVLDTLPAKQQVEAKLNNYISEKRSQLEQRTINFQQRIAKLQQQAQNASNAVQKQLQDSANALNQRLRQYRMQVQQQLQRKRAQLLQPVYKRIDQAIKTVAERNDLEFVLNERTSNGQDIIYYASANQKNITDEVINELLSEQQ